MVARDESGIQQTVIAMSEQSLDDIELGNGDTLEERLAELDLEDDETVSVEEMRERLRRSSDTDTDQEGDER